MHRMPYTYIAYPMGYIYIVTLEAELRQTKIQTHNWCRVRLVHFETIFISCEFNFKFSYSAVFCLPFFQIYCVWKNTRARVPNFRCMLKVLVFPVEQNSHWDGRSFVCQKQIKYLYVTKRMRPTSSFNFHGAYKQ